MSSIGFGTVRGQARSVCPLHGTHGGARCPFCTAEPDAELSIAHAPLIVPPPATTSTRP